jgi:two-component sensor histidine kinase/tetratricopeptide (TPR) repeat protein
MKSLSWLAFCLLLPTMCLAQVRIDSLKSRLAIELDSLDMEDVASCLSMIGNEFLAGSQYDSALDYYFKSLSVGKGLQVRAATLNSIGIVYNNKGNADSSIAYYSRALESYTMAHDTVRAAILQINLSIIYKNMGLYDLSLENAFSALRSLEDRQQDRTLASLYNNIGSVYLKIGDNVSALDYFRRALNIRIKIGFTRGVGQSHTNIGELFLASGQYDSALTNLFKSLGIKRADNNKSETGSTLNLIGQAYLELNRPSEAEAYLLESRELKRLSGERAVEGSILNNLGRLRIMQRDYTAAERYLNEAAVLIRETETLDELRKNLALHVMLFKLKGQPAKALQYAEELIVVKDSLLNKEKAESLHAMQLQYDVERREQQIELLRKDQDTRNAELKTKQVWLGALAMVLGMFAIATGVVILQYRTVSKSKRRVELLLKEVHHRVKNNLQILSSLFHLPYQDITDKVALQAVKDGEGRVNAMALIHGMLSSDAMKRSIPLQNYLSELTGYLSSSYGYSKRHGAIVVNCNGVQLDVDKAVPVGLIVNELVSNSMKYAFASQSSPVISVQVQSMTDTYELQVSDNGTGFREPVDLERATSFGLRMINLLARELKGKINMITSGQTCFNLTFPKS